MPANTSSFNTIEHAMAELVEADPDIAHALPLVGAPSPRERDKGFATFFSTIVSQQLSTEAARAIMGRVNTLLPELHAKAVMEVEGQALRDAGLSWRKIEYAKGLAEAELAGTFSAVGLEQLSDDEAIAAITELRGFGRWSAEIYLMFSLQRPDIFPADDLALRVALGRLKGMDDKPTPKQARQLVEHWAPWRSVGSLFLWHYYRGEPL
ncbi:DNA-3-methyladenine glycosylase family protein [Vreelandella titanicae]|jgi:DNA-3-methyladenine glycosylase II|uniref:DNA-3-methyladenine glycosylase II n=1 Tax=Vreelandella titanicae BH1 TaxID=1204738 RepID=L9UDZ3_9GAMM|nr:DNA-3-methyladenine glycosylase [Halomonas titanicae]ELY22866.1 DNA glycosylase [Halomonas titanicae BH1]MCE7517888.1 DNA-3-methyladenine glycosylase [Halomonas titanicae]NVE89233.1 DNA-3-methyladenine glycosylase 2 family protein [Halomonas titanicae]QNU63683.1 DNA-3-methyladenine glycosylase 2 family protein [Halomonas titanicae]